MTGSAFCEFSEDWWFTKRLQVVELWMAGIGDMGKSNKTNGGGGGSESGGMVNVKVLAE